MNSDRDLQQILDLRNLPKRLDLGAFVIAPYLLAIIWQYFCSYSNKPIAWILAGAVSLLVWVFYLSLGEDPAERWPWQLWAAVALPLLFFYLIRLPFPDVSFDVLNYHIYHSERALRGPLLTPQDFFPTPAPFNPTPDIVTGLYRYALGYRLGTIANFLALMWTATILNRTLGDWIQSTWLRSLAIFLVIATEQVLFQINNYMVDLLALPLLLEATWIAIDAGTRERFFARTLRLSLLLGVAAAFKLTNLIYGVPIVLVYAFNILEVSHKSGLVHRAWRLSKISPLALLAFVLPLLPFTALIYRLTGNPVFPLYNGLFKSPYWAQGAAFDPRWGPHGIFETVIWPVAMFFRAARLCEYPFYSGRLSIGFVLAAALILLAWRQRVVWQLAFIVLFGSLVWSAGSGYIRYALYLELMSGVIIVWALGHIWKERRRAKLWTFVSVPFVVLLLVHVFFALLHGYRWEWSARATVLEHTLSFDLREASNLLRDRSLDTYVSPEDVKAFDEVEAWIETTYKTTAIQGLLKPVVPAAGVRLGEFFLTPVSRRKFADVLNAHQTMRTFTLTDQENLENARKALAARGLVTGSSRSVPIYYFSRSLKFDLLLVEVMRKPPAAGNEKGVPLPDSAFNAKLSVIDAPQTMRPGQKYDLQVMLKNESDVIWPGRQPTWQFQVTVGNRWLKQSGEKVTDIDGRSALFDDLSPGAATQLPLTITAPGKPGIYILQLDAIQESVAWFADRGSEVLSITVKVE
jgi:hypothetical protein